MSRNGAASALQFVCFALIALVAVGYYAFPSMVPDLREGDNGIMLCAVLFFAGLIGGSIIRDD